MNDQDLLSERLLRYQQVMARIDMSEDYLAGLHHTQVETYHNETVYQTYMQMRGYVLTEDAEGPVRGSKREVFAFTYAVRPRWLPKFLWKRVPWAEARPVREVTMSVQPKWKYPHATIVGELGRPLRMLEAPSYRVMDEFRR